MTNEEISEFVTRQNEMILMELFHPTDYSGWTYNSKGEKVYKTKNGYEIPENANGWTV